MRKRDGQAWLTEVTSGRQSVQKATLLKQAISEYHLGCSRMYLRGQAQAHWLLAEKRLNCVLFPLVWTETKKIQVGKRKITSQPRAGHQPIQKSDFIKCAIYPVFILKTSRPTKLITRWN